MSFAGCGEVTRIDEAVLYAGAASVVFRRRSDTILGTINDALRISQPADESRKMQGLKCRGSAQRFLSIRAAVYNTFNVQNHLTSASTHRSFRAAAMNTWRAAVAERLRHTAFSRSSFSNVTRPAQVMTACSFRWAPRSASSTSPISRPAAKRKPRYRSPQGRGRTA